MIENRRFSCESSPEKPRSITKSMSPSKLKLSRNLVAEMTEQLDNLSRTSTIKEVVTNPMSTLMNRVTSNEINVINEVQLKESMERDRITMEPQHGIYKSIMTIKGQGENDSICRAATPMMPIHDYSHHTSTSHMLPKMGFNTDGKSGKSPNNRMKGTSTETMRMNTNSTIH